jgi:hypothetical protein
MIPTMILIILCLTILKKPLESKEDNSWVWVNKSLLSHYVL